MRQTKAPGQAAQVKVGSLVHFKEMTLAVMKSYVEAKQLPALCAQEIDPAPLTASRIRTTTTVEYTADVELATEKVLGGDPALERAWFRLALGERVEAHVANKVYLRCGRIYEARGLQLWVYLRRERYPHRRSSK